MGRNSTSKRRKEEHPKKELWLQKVAPTVLSRGIHNISANELAAMMGMSKSTYYEYFASKEDLLVEVLRLKFERALQIQSILSDERIPFADRYSHGLGLIVDVLKDVSEAFLRELKMHYPEQWGMLEQMVEAVLVLVGAYYKQGMEQRIFRTYTLETLIETDRIFLYTLLNPDYLSQTKRLLSSSLQEFMHLKFVGILNQED